MVMNIAQSPAPSSQPATLGPISSLQQQQHHHHHHYHLTSHQLDYSHFVSGLLAPVTISQFCDILSRPNLAKHRQDEFVNREGICFEENKNSQY